VDAKAEMIVAGMLREGDPELEPSLVDNAVAELRRHFVEPELRARGESGADPTAIDQSLIVLGPDGESTVFLDHEADFVAIAGVAAEVVRPEDVFVGQITALWPDGVDPDAAWTGYVTARQGRVLVCDFRRDRQSVRPLLARADEFIEAADLALTNDLLAPAIEHLNTAAELAVIVLIRLGAHKVGRDHAARRKWLRLEANVSGVPEKFATAVTRLGVTRNPARYADAPIELDGVAAAELEIILRDLVAYAGERAG